jgi:hypothetical protein
MTMRVVIRRKKSTTMMRIDNKGKKNISTIKITSYKKNKSTSTMKITNRKDKNTNVMKITCNENHDENHQQKK